MTREEAIHELMNTHKYFYEDKRLDEAIDMAISALSAERVGVWIWKTEDKYKCSECEHETHVDECMEEPIYEYCPYCGAKMKGGNNAEHL